jgi:hypothetical protein
MSLSDQTIITLLTLSGIGHIAISVGSIAVPKLLDWKKHVDAGPPLFRQVYWTYSAYIKLVNIAFGVVSIIATHELIGPSLLAKCINLFIIIYWVGRMGLEFFYFDRSSLTGVAKFADRALNVLITLFILIHGAAFASNLQLL